MHRRVWSSALTELKMRGFQMPLMFRFRMFLAGAAPKAEADVLKLDRSFVCAGLQGTRERIVIENLVNVAELGMEVVCEGGDAGAGKRAQDIGCHIAQGYYITARSGRGV
ncbi:MAG: EAL domain-containing protein [Enterocloster sp.]